MVQVRFTLVTFTLLTVLSHRKLSILTNFTPIASISLCFLLSLLACYVAYVALP